MHALKRALAALAAAALAVHGLSAPAHAGPVDWTFSPVAKPVTSVGAAVGQKAAKMALFAPVHRYVAAVEATGTANPVPAGTTGLAGTMTVEHPTVAAGDYFSLMEIAAVNTITTSGSAQRNIVEAGWEVNASEYGDSNPHFFVGAWKHGTFLGRNATGGFVDVAGTPNAGDSVLAHVGTLKKIGINYYPTTPAGGGWWVSYNNSGGSTVWVGYYPSSIWTGGAPSVTFTDLDEVQWFGEIVEESGGAGTTEMGDGSCGSSHVAPWTAAADPALIAGMQTFQGASTYTNAAPYKYATDPTRWDHFSTSTSGIALGGDGVSC